MGLLEIHTGDVVIEVIEVESLEMACEVVCIRESLERDKMVHYCLKLSGEFHGRQAKSYYFRPSVH